MLCVVAGSGDRKPVMAAVTLPEEVSATGSTQGFLLVRAPGGFKGKKLMRYWGAGLGRRGHCGVGVGGEGPAWPVGTGGNSARPSQDRLCRPPLRLQSAPPCRRCRWAARRRSSP